MCVDIFIYIVADQGKPTEEKFSKLKQMYTKLRAEHVQLLRTVSWITVFVELLR